MKKEYYLEEKVCILNFSEKYCKNESDVLKSESFQKILNLYLKKLTKAEDLDFLNLSKNEENISEKFLEFFHLLLVYPLNEIREIKAFAKVYQNFIENKSYLAEFIEDFYDYWRLFERYSVMHARNFEGIIHNSFIEATNEFTSLILKLYRTISKNLTNQEYVIYRELPSGVNASMVLGKNSGSLSDDYLVLKETQVIAKVLIKPPFITYSKKNTRNENFLQVEKNFVLDLKYNAEEYLCYKIYVGKSLAHVYFHVDYLRHGLSLCNLFHVPNLEAVNDLKPDLICIFGGKLDYKLPGCFYEDDNIYVGFLPFGDDIDYFGYMKKMLLTLNNLLMIKKKSLPLHGAMVAIEFKNGKTKNVCLVGDSGAGKSETLEALRVVAGEEIKNMTTIFDDMGNLVIEEGKLKAYGTEIGAFVRLDDLEHGYAYKEMDRAIFVNPNKVNARLIVPVTSYKNIIKGQKLDLLLYANNYEDPEEDLKFFTEKNEALEVFRSGKRFAKGTTTEKGIVKSYFANPFGPLQKMEETEKLLEKFFGYFFENNLKTGILYTRLGVKEYESEGPKKGAKRLLDYLLTEK